MRLRKSVALCSKPNGSGEPRANIRDFLIRSKESVETLSTNFSGNVQILLSSVVSTLLPLIWRSTCWRTSCCSQISKALRTCCAWLITSPTALCAVIIGRRGCIVRTIVRALWDVCRYCVLRCSLNVSRASILCRC